MEKLTKEQEAEKAKTAESNRVNLLKDLVDVFEASINNSRFTFLFGKYLANHPESADKLAGALSDSVKGLFPEKETEKE